MRPLEPQALKTIPFWGATFKISMDVFLNTYEYEEGLAWGQIVRFKSANATEEGETGARIPSIWATTTESGANRLHITSYIDNPANPLNSPHFPENYELNFYGERAPVTGEWFTITISQRPFKVKKSSSLIELILIS